MSAREEAARWFVRLGRAAPDHPDRGRFEAWLMASATHAQEYAAFETLWSDFDSNTRLDALAQAQDRQRQAQLASRRTLVKRGTLGLALLGLGLAGGPALLSAWREQVLYGTTLASGTGERRTLTLPDGSVIVLNAQSRIAITYMRGQRRVVLEQGEAIFDVRPDADRPFVVDSGLADITVLGTRFSVLRLDGAWAPPQGAEVRIGVAHGRVRVAPRQGTAGPWLLSAGESLDVTATGGTRRERDLAVAFDWERGTLVFDNATLAEVAATLSRYRQAPVRLAQPLPDARVTAVVQIADGERFLHNLPRIAPVRIEMRGRSALILPR